MDENLARLNRIYPNGKYVLIPKYIPEQWESRPYDSSFDNKASITKWKSKPLSYEEAQKAVENGYRIGWIIPKGLVIVDIDNKDNDKSQFYLEKLLKKFEVKYNYNYTSKGIHCLFTDRTCQIKSDSRLKCGINLEVDTRANETGYVVLPCNDPHRKWGTWNDFVEEIPYFLIPLMKDNTPSFIGLGEGDGRNNALFKWRSRLEVSNKLSKEQIEKCIRIINENLFSIAMPNTELFKTVLREKTEEKKKEKENPYNIIADEMIRKKDIICRNSVFYMFNGTYYSKIDEVELEKIIHNEFNNNMMQSGRNEVINFIRIKAQVPAEDMDKEWHKIAVKNGVLNLVTGELSPPNKTEINTIGIDYNYDPDPPASPRIMQFMKELCSGDPIKITFMYQIAGYCLLKKNLFEKFFIFKGEGGTGKSTFMNLIERMVGTENQSCIGLADFDKDYYLAKLMGKLVNKDDDLVDTKALENTGRFKSIISGNKISVRQIYRDVTEFYPYATCIFSCNKLPRIMDRTSGIYRRMILIELNNKIQKPDPLFMNKVTESDMEYFLFKSVQAIKIALEEGRFKITMSEAELLKTFQRRQSPINEWLYENQMSLGDIVGKRTLPLYNQFKLWCEENGYKNVPSTYSFKEDMCILFDVVIDFDKEESLVQIFNKPGEYDPKYKPF